ncbi:ribonucleoside-diphosphate reductase [Candidatus Roizmanbacteria bacterium RIFCSPLOWO2_01_FULL_40_14]|uniref:Vitamin B12-dependent ribonucleotide reductase n=2 Tax=Candidatus Roizmaniibacteriota TaxID=1752723 RepID=A0A0G0WAE9_9BACT|nr:MAG: Ribonucleoside-diphosphate reductase [Candidatus Roizmanbacteria bacterium GW2011_GWB1_40_7]KKR94123.1 MAG: Ribonucleoside-diphosphate reductase [Candidatus Roizmanbacteria bacterium GW2011_GWA1_41_13]OGK50311.1 MAG: ribonucleoside-diphosphate reductase [Candidatus Roizmanbacteria bacterium RIFCSPLOWO2_01_FULL_40_14]
MDDFNGIRQKVFQDRYSLKDKTGKAIETQPEEMWQRVAKYVASYEQTPAKKKKWEEKFIDAMQEFQYVPGGRILSGAGTGYNVTFYNCFVIPSPKDSREGILESLKNMVEIMASGGGVGINLSSLRPRGFRVRKVNGFSSGPCNWAELFSVATKDIIQQGGTRRGALMLMLWDWHPDIEEFITVKQDLSRINGANLSVCISDRFMQAVENDEDWQLLFPDTTDPDYDEYWDGDIEKWLERGGKITIKKTVRARKIWDMIAEAAWRSAEPGVVFLERCNKYYNNWYWNKVICVNPCGEEPLAAWGVCNLGSINLSALVKNGDDPDVAGEFDYDRLKELVHIAVRFQDNIVDLDPYIFEEIRQTQLNGERRIGLGTMGLGDALIKLHMRYGSPEGLEFADKVYKMIRDEAYRASVENAKEKGIFPKFDKKKYPQGRFIRELPRDLQKDIKQYGIRNSLLLMQAPTGTTSLLSNTTSGIEPVYEFEFIRRDRLGKHVIRHHIYEKWYAKHGKELESGAIKRPEWFVSANDLTPEDHVKMQAVVQKYVDASISKTVNAPSTHTVEDVKKLYNLAYKLGLKGVTYMREGSRPGVLERKDVDVKEENKPVKIEAPKVKPRPMMVTGATYAINTPMGKAFITINTNGNNEPLEVFINIGKAGSDVTAMAEALGRMVSLNLRFNAHLSPRDRIKEIIHHFSGIGGSTSIGFGKERVRSLPDALAKVLATHFSDVIDTPKTNGVSHNLPDDSQANGVTNGHMPAALVESNEIVQPLHLEKEDESYDFCPDCGEAALAYEEGCKKCYSCGYSAC